MEQWQPPWMETANDKNKGAAIGGKGPRPKVIGTYYNYSSNFNFEGSP